MKNDNLYALLAARFPTDQERCALEVPGGRSHGWGDIEQGSARLANLLASLALPTGSRIAAQVDKSPEALLLYLAVLRAGHVYLPLNTAYKAAEVAYFVEDAQPAVFVCAPERLEEMQQLLHRPSGAGPAPLLFTLGGMDSAEAGSLAQAAAGQPSDFATVPRQAGDLAAILYTSGTTGRSKGAMLTHRNLADNALVLQQFWQWQAEDVLLHALPLFHVHGLFVAANGALLNGSKMLFLPHFDSEAVLRLLPQASIFMGVPTYYTRLLAHPAFDASSCRSMRLFVSGSAPLLPATFQAFEQRSGHRILERYGMTETLMLTSNPYAGERRAGTVGLPLPGLALRVTDASGQPCAPGGIGEIQVRGPSVFKGYWRLPEKTAEEFTRDGYFRTGDLGQRDAQGYLHIVGRSKDMIISGGFNVYPKEVELVLDALEGVEESAVIGLPHADYGEAVTAVVVPQPGARLSEESLLAALRPRLASFKLPKRIVLADGLPRNAMGKVQKNQLRERLATAGR